MTMLAGDVPHAMLELPEALAHLARGRLAVLTGAGCSTESGIPDYRGEGTARRARNPLQHRAFMTDAKARARYWARSYVGWARLAAAEPNPAHRALAAMEAQGRVVGIVTQNVDGLHGVAGSRRVVELHGNVSRVICLDCGRRRPRRAVQSELADLNPSLRRQRATMLTDGDAALELDDRELAALRIPTCVCGGVLKPDVVFFGGSVPATTVAEAMAIVDASEALLVVGSSLAVFSGLRFVRHAAKNEKPIAIVNLGSTRGDGLAHVKVDARAGLLLPQLAAYLAAQPA